uniref:Centrosomal protein 112 n=1 Tax=Catharus ustulatus TaxID=91951 RepID=A0A8C3V1Y8_CATUS
MTRCKRKRCSLWIKKLCKPSGAGTGIVGRENRNLYAKLLLHMLKRGVLNGPFSQKPEEGMLRTLPAYISVYFDEPSSSRVLDSSPDCVPEWVMGDLGNRESNASSVEDSSSSTPPLEMKMKIAEGKFHEEKLKLQQKHDADVQKILDRKNDEIDVLKSAYVKKQKESEDTIRKLEKKVQTLVRESQVVRDTKEQQIQELKKMCEQSNDSLKNEWEKRLHDAVAEMEKEKFNIRKKHMEDMQELLEETNSRLARMEEEYLQQTKSTNETVQKLGARVQQLTVEAENSNFQRQKLSQEKIEVEQRYQDVCSQLQELRTRYNLLQKDKEQIMQEYKENLQQLQSKFDVDRDFMKQEQAQVCCQVEKEEQLRRVTEVQRLQAQQAGTALEEFKRQVELNSEKDSAEMKQRVEGDLSRSKLLREKQAQEFSRQLDEIKKRYEQQIVELKLEHEQEKTHLFQQHNAVQDCLVRDHQREIEKLEKQLRGAMAEHESQSQESKKRDGQVISCLERQIRKLREELIQANALRNHQLLDLSLQRDEEKLKAARDKEAALNSLKVEMEKVISELKMKHTAETEAALNKASSRLRQTEEHFSHRLTKSSQEIAELKKTISSLREESSRQQLAAEQRLQEVVQKLENEKQQLMADNDRAIKALQDQVENYCGQLYDAQRRLQQQELKAQQQLITMREEYEKILKGLIPASSKKDLEDTISSLKSQVNSYSSEKLCFIQY